MHYKRVYQGMRFSKIEIRDLLKSLLAIGVAFSIAQVGFDIFSTQFFLVLIISIITVGIGFIAHELAHKYFAQRFGCWSEFRSDDKMLVLAIIISFLGVVFAAPGAVMINGHLTRKEYGIISAAGPATNLGIALIFFILAISVPIGFVQFLGTIGFTINSWLALFNMIPFSPFDGKKILGWNKTVYGVLVGFGVVFMFVGGMIF